MPGNPLLRQELPRAVVIYSIALLCRSHAIAGPPIRSFATADCRPALAPIHCLGRDLPLSRTGQPQSHSTKLCLFYSSPCMPGWNSITAFL